MSVLLITSVGQIAPSPIIALRSNFEKFCEGIFESSKVRHLVFLIHRYGHNHSNWISSPNDIKYCIAFTCPGILFVSMYRSSGLHPNINISRTHMFSLLGLYPVCTQAEGVGQQVKTLDSNTKVIFRVTTCICSCCYLWLCYCQIQGTKVVFLLSCWNYFVVFKSAICVLRNKLQRTDQWLSRILAMMDDENQSFLFVPCTL